MYFTYEESEVFNSLFENKQSQLIDKTNTKSAIIEFLNEAIETCDNSDLLEALAGTLRKVKILDDYTIEYLANNCPITPDTKLA